ncbi:A-kinase anchor protein 1, mitochondrial-like isoform X1, partial [Clarias magur]
VKIGAKMLQLPLRPLVPLSALALLGWCWYTFRKKNNLQQNTKEGLSVSSAARKQSTVKTVVEQDTAVAESETTPEAQDVKTHCHFQSQEKQVEDQNVDHGCSQLCSTMSESSVLSAASHATILTSTPIVRLVKGVRPEPEGEVARAQASLLLAETPETEPEKEDDSVKGRSDFKEMKETESFSQQPTGIVCPRENGVTTMSEKQRERSPSLSESGGLVVKAINGATEEITAIGGGILKRKGHVEPRVTSQSQVQLQKEIEKNNSLAVTKMADESVSSVHTPREKYSTFPAGEDSGCSMWHSEEGVEAERVFSKFQAVEKKSGSVSVSFKTYQATDQKSEKLTSAKADASKGANRLQCVNGESWVASKRATQSRNSSHTLWNIEVPAHLVGRLIGKKGKYISSLKQSSGAKIYVSTLPYTFEFQICHIEGSELQVEKALALIRKKFKDLDLSNHLNSLQPAVVHPVPITSWLLLPQDGTVEVIVPRVEAANYLFVQQHTHPTYYGLSSLSEQMLYCYSHSGCPSLPTPVEAGVLCAAPSPNGAWWRAQVIQHYKDSDIVQIRYVDYGGYVTVNLSCLKQIRSDFVTLPFQASEVMLENIAPLPGKGRFAIEAKEALEELTQGIPLIMKVTGSQSGLPLVHLWRHAGDE